MSNTILFIFRNEEHQANFVKEAFPPQLVYGIQLNHPLASEFPGVHRFTIKENRIFHLELFGEEGTLMKILATSLQQRLIEIGEINKHPS